MRFSGLSATYIEDKIITLIYIKIMAILLSHGTLMVSHYSLWIT